MNAYFSPLGNNDDINIAYRHVHKGLMGLLERRDPRGIYQIPISHSHSAETYGFVGILDIYRATGDKHMLDAMLGAWELINKHWELPGGSLAICEYDEYPPNSLHITPTTHTGETCSQVWWIKFNQKLHQLYPTEEKYINIIEKSIYNVILPNQDADGVVCYHTNQGRVPKAGGNWVVKKRRFPILGAQLFASKWARGGRRNADGQTVHEDRGVVHSRLGIFAG
ncbi:MAG: beta-L-arabinofuranosidase domain-containing protein [Phycisphaerae bacterium]